MPSPKRGNSCSKRLGKGTSRWCSALATPSTTMPWRCELTLRNNLARNGAPPFRKNKKSPPDLAVKQGLNGGWEFATLSFPRWHLAPRLRGCQLPDAILHGKRSLRPRSRAAQRPVCRSTELSSEAFQLACADGCATGLRTRSRHVCDLLSASSPLSFGSAA